MLIGGKKNEGLSTRSTLRVIPEGDTDEPLGFWAASAI